MIVYIEYYRIFFAFGTYPWEGTQRLLRCKGCFKVSYVATFLALPTGIDWGLPSHRVHLNPHKSYTLGSQYTTPIKRYIKYIICIYIYIFMKQTQAFGWWVTYPCKRKPTKSLQGPQPATKCFATASSVEQLKEEGQGLEELWAPPIAVAYRDSI